MHTLDPVNYATQLKTVMQKLQPTSVRRQQQRKIHISQDLHNCPFVFVRNDAVKKPLQSPYDGPFKVLQRTDKHFTLDIAGKEKTISLDRLKTAYMDDTPPFTDDTTATNDTKPQQSTSTTLTPVTTKTTQRVTRSGRHVHWPKKLAEYRSLP